MCNSIKVCENCGLDHTGEYGSGRFCSIKCGKGFSTKDKRKEINEKVSLKLKDRGNPKVNKICLECNCEFSIIYPKRNQKTCSKTCGMKLFAKTELGKLHYINMGLMSVQSQSDSKRSKNEIYFSELCEKYFKNIECNKPIFNGWDADIIIHDIKYAVLWNGKWHYEKITKLHSIDQVQNRDKIKIKEIINYGYIPYVIKDMGRYNKMFVEEQFNLFIHNIRTCISSHS